MIRLIIQIIVFVFLLIPQYLSATVEIDEPDWKDMVGDLYLYSPEKSSANSSIGINVILRNDENLWEHLPQEKVSSVTPVKYAPIATIDHSQQNSQRHESLILFSFGTVIIGLIRISKRRRMIFTQDNHRLIAKISYKT